MLQKSIIFGAFSLLVPTRNAHPFFGCVLASFGQPQVSLRRLKLYFFKLRWVAAIILQFPVQTNLIYLNPYYSLLYVFLFFYFLNLTTQL